MYNTRLNKEQIKAIRCVLGFNTDLRKYLNSVNKDSIWYFIDHNRFGLLGVEFGLAKPHPTNKEWREYETCIDKMVSQVIYGK